MSLLKSLKAAKDIDGLAFLLGYKPKNLAYILYKLPDAKKYATFEIPKRSGGVRIICAPNDQLKLLQRRMANLLYACRDEIDRESGLGSLSHGIRRGHSILTNARAHQKRRYVLNLDLKDFFPSFNFGRVRGFFIKNRAFELDEKVATLIAQIACHQNGLPQGSPCSPVISDLIAHLLDARLAKMAKKERVTYSRYADDLTFSTNQKTFPPSLAVQREENGVLWELGEELVSRITDAGFAVNPEKTRMQCCRSRQLVTNLTVNAKVNVRREYYKQTRAMCDTLFKTGEYANVPLSKSLARRIKSRKNKIESKIEQSTSDVTIDKSVKSIFLLSGRLAHIHFVKESIDIRDEIDKRKHKTAFRRLYHRFFFIGTSWRLTNPWY